MRFGGRWRREKAAKTTTKTTTTSDNGHISSKTVEGIQRCSKIIIILYPALLKSAKKLVQNIVIAKYITYENTKGLQKYKENEKSVQKKNNFNTEMK